MLSNRGLLAINCKNLNRTSFWSEFIRWLDRLLHLKIMKRLLIFLLSFIIIHNKARVFDLLVYNPTDSRFPEINIKVIDIRALFYSPQLPFNTPSYYIMNKMFRLNCIWKVLYKNIIKKLFLFSLFIRYFPASRRSCFRGSGC